MPSHTSQVCSRWCLSVVQPFEIGADYCGQHDINHPIVGAVPLSRDAAMTWNDVTATSLAVALTTGDYTVAFVAMDDGTVRKVRSSEASLKDSFSQA